LERSGYIIFGQYCFLGGAQKPTFLDEWHTWFLWRRPSAYVGHQTLQEIEEKCRLIVQKLNCFFRKFDYLCKNFFRKYA
jgi:hypothetical protein